MNNRKSLIQTIARRSEGYIAFTAILFSLLGVVTAIIPLNPLSFGLLLGLWIPLCCTIFVGISYLCREVVEIEKRLEKLEKNIIP